MHTEKRSRKSYIGHLGMAVAVMALLSFNAHAATDAAAATDAQPAKHAHHKKHKHVKHAAKPAPAATANVAPANKAPVAKSAASPSAHKAVAKPAYSASASLPAVSGLNGAVDIRGGAAKGNVVGLIAGKVSAPILHDYGVQLDAALGDVGGNAVKGVGAHAFYRDPKTGLAGGTYSRGWYANNYYNRFGAEGEYYQGNLTYGARAGYQNGTIHHGEYTNLDLTWYMNDNLAITPGFRNTAGQAWGRIGTEWQPQSITSVPGLTVFASTGAGNHGYAFGLVGARFYFGNDKTLIRRHREDDPMELVPDESADNFSQFHPTSAVAAAPPT